MRNNRFFQRYLLAALLVISCFSYALALTVDTPLHNKEEERRAKALFNEIRCVTCTGESIAQSQADIASDVRRAIREHIQQGHSNEEIKLYLVSRYGDAILMEPPLNNVTALLWFAPVLLLGAGALLARHYFRRMRQ